MSTIKITFSLQPLDFFPLERGQVEIRFNDGVLTHTLYERLTTGTAYSRQFKEVAYVAGQPALSERENEQAMAFASAFNRDWGNMGGNRNLSATVSGNEVTITAKSGTFATTGSQYTGNVLVVGGFVVENSSQVPNLAFIVTFDTGGDCSTIDFGAAAADGAPPYTLKKGETIIVSGWDGQNHVFPLERGKTFNINVTDASGQVKSQVVNVPRKLKVGEFKERFLQYATYSDVNIESVNPVAWTEPIEFALTDTTDSNGSGYQTSNSFPGVLPGLYRLWIKDKYGCEVSKIIEVREFEDSTINEITPFFDIPEANALIFTKKVEHGGEVRKNYFNTNSHNERSIGVRHGITQSWLAEHSIATRFRSSWPWHIVTLKRCDGQKFDLVPIRVQQNLGVSEKIDCNLFSVDGGIGVYFSGGNEYAPNTDTVVGASDFDGIVPEWGEIGQLVSIDGVGAKYITGSGYDDARGYYFTVDGSTSDDVDTKIQVTHNRQIYNLFDFFVYMSDVPKKAWVEIQYGNSFNEVVDTYISETIERIEDSSDWHLVKWGDSRNRGDMVFQQFPEPYIMLKGKFDNVYPGESETSRGDIKTYSLRQDAYLGFSFSAGLLSRQLVNKLHLASGTEYFEINGVPLVKVGNASVENLGTTNLKKWSCDFDYGGDLLGIKSDVFDVLDVSTGKVGGGHSAKGGDIPPLVSEALFDNKTRFIDGSGNYIVIGGDYVVAD